MDHDFGKAWDYRDSQVSAMAKLRDENMRLRRHVTALQWLTIVEFGAIVGVMVGVVKGWWS